MEDLKEKLNNGIKDIKEIKLNSEEKSRILQNILESSKIVRPIKSPYAFVFSIFNFKKSSLAYYGATLCLVILGGSAVFAGGRSLPGSALYPLKVNVIEPAYGAFMFSGVAKVKYESQLANERLREAEILAERNELDDVKDSELKVLLEKHAKAFDEGVVNLEKDKGKRKEHDTLVEDFETKLDTHAKKLDLLSEKKNNKENKVKYSQISITAKEKVENSRKKRMERDSDSNTSQGENDEGEDLLPGVNILP